VLDGGGAADEDGTGEGWRDGGIAIRGDFNRCFCKDPTPGEMRWNRRSLTADAPEGHKDADFKTDKEWLMKSARKPLLHIPIPSSICVHLSSSAVGNLSCFPVWALWCFSVVRKQPEKSHPSRSGEAG